MQIPEKYRERYDNLARSHPWMREMRDETNGIAPESPLVGVLPDGDAVAILRKWGNFWSAAHSTYTQCDSNWEVTTMRTLADMVERDYVRRDDFDFMSDALKFTKAERDEWKAKAEGYAEALEKLGCSVLANGTVFPPPSYDGADSRERLEADIIDRSEQCRTILGNLRDGLNTVTVSVDVVRGWLDRQAAITEVECIDRWDARAAIENADLKAEIAKLTDERDDLQGRVDYLESRHCEWSDQNDLGDGCMLRHDELVDKLRAERDELKAEVDAYRSKYDDMEFIVPIDKAMEFTTDPPGYVKKALADMHERIITLTDERGEYREKLSKALDLAHEIGRLQP